MALDIIDLTSDEESPAKLLKSFQHSKSEDQPSSPRINGKTPGGVGVNKSSELGYCSSVKSQALTTIGPGKSAATAWALSSLDVTSASSKCGQYSPALVVAEAARHSSVPPEIPASVRAAFSDVHGGASSNVQQSALDVAVESSGLQNEAWRAEPDFLEPTFGALQNGNCTGTPRAKVSRLGRALRPSPVVHNLYPRKSAPRTGNPADALADFINGIPTKAEDEAVDAFQPEGSSGRRLTERAEERFEPPLKRLRLDSQYSHSSERLADVPTSKNPDTGRQHDREVRLLDVTDPETERVSLSNEPSPVPTGSKRQFTPEDNALLKRLKEVENMKWDQILEHFPGRTKATLQVHYSTKIKYSKLAPARFPRPSSTPARVPTSAAPTHPSTNPIKSGQPYSDEEDALLRRLKEEVGLSWEEMLPQFQGRSAGSLQVRYYTKVKQRIGQMKPVLQDTAAPRSKRARKSNVAATDGFVSWAEAKELMRDGPAEEASVAGSKDEASSTEGEHQHGEQLRSMSQILRQREMGVTVGRKAWTSCRRQIPDEMKDQVFRDYKLDQFYHGTSGDVVGLSWSPDGRYFAAGSIAITDSRSMQYNMSRNLLVGDRARGDLQELLDHHVERPIVDDADNPNALNSMRQTQDSRLFLTVTATAFSPVKGKEHWLFTVGADRMLRRYSVAGKGVNRISLRYAAEHAAPIELLALHPDRTMVATGCHAASGSVNIFTCEKTAFNNKWSGSPARKQLDTSAAVFPSALKFGEAPGDRNYLLAGFSGDQDKDLAGETALWDLKAQKRIELRGTTRNVFDVAWNPSPSPASIRFAVASNSTGLNVGKGIRTAVHCFARTEKGCQSIVQYECPARDINDVVICPYDDCLVAAGATDGKVYIWDQRFVRRGQKPLHVLKHGASLNVLPHDRDPELTDTGVRFLSWGATKNRLYSGSSDGTIKVWNPSRHSSGAHAEDIEVPRQQRAAVMSGAFSPDRQDLLIGTENGQVNVYKAGITSSAVHKARAFKLHTGSGPSIDHKESLRISAELIQSSKVELRPCGAMPFTQVVQGPAYDGPFLAPCKSELDSAESKLQKALDFQYEIASYKAQAGYMDIDNDPELIKAQMHVREAQSGMEDLQSRQEFAQISRAKAEEFQRSLLRSRDEQELVLQRAQARFGDAVESCKVPGCGHVCHVNEVEDNSRAELRIPSTLRSMDNKAMDLSKLTFEDETEPCSRCSPGRVRDRSVLCLACRMRKLGMTTVCAKCSAPARVMTDRKDPLCETCAFECFRCSGPVTLLNGASVVQCQSCQLTWKAGALGYELVSRATHSSKKNAGVSAIEEYDDFGAKEREHYATRWEVQTNTALW